MTTPKHEKEKSHHSAAKTEEKKEAGFDPNAPLEPGQVQPERTSGTTAEEKAQQQEKEAKSS